MRYYELLKQGILIIKNSLSTSNKVIKIKNINKYPFESLF